MKKLLSLILLMSVNLGHSTAQTSDSDVGLTVPQLRSQIKTLQTEEEKVALVTKVVGTGREDLFDECLEPASLAARMLQAIRKLPPTPMKDKNILFLLRAPSVFWGDALAGQPENPMDGVIRVSVADVCIETLKRNFPEEDFDLHDKHVLEEFASSSGRQKLAAKLKLVLDR